MGRSRSPGGGLTKMRQLGEVAVGLLDPVIGHGSGAQWGKKWRLGATVGKNGGKRSLLSYMYFFKGGGQHREHLSCTAINKVV